MRVPKLQGCIELLLFVLMTMPGAGQTVINESEAVDIGGIQQWINIKGTSDKNPILLNLHGGPGNSVMKYADKFTSELQKHFVVVQWDQRESGKTLKLNATDRPLSVSLMESDAIEVVNYLRKRFSQDKIYLMGHSWGGFLALALAAHHPELLKACFALAPMVNQLESERQSLEWMLGKARKSNDKNAIEKLSQVKIPFGNGDQLYYHRHWLLLYNGKNPYPQDYVRTWAVRWLPVFNEASGINFFVTAPEINCPVYFFVGSTDRQASSQITEEYFKVLKAEKKDLFWFTNSGHSLNLTEPKKLQEIIISLLKAKI